jgi:predicted ATPase/class 3 adenylate cyclase
MTDLPTGTVTFLFTDIEGSTGLLQTLGDRYPAVLDEHAAIIRRAVAEAGGIEVSTHGDAFFVVFASPAGAVRAAVAAQRGLAANDWSPGPPVRVRMGVHTGEGVLGGDDYAGIDVHRAARIADAAHGGQVLVSNATRGLVQQALPAGASLRSLGAHRLRGIAEPERLHQLVVEGLASDFPPPRAQDARPNNLPAQLTSFVGREEQIAEAEGLLDRARLLTLTGPGGSGKSRLALRVAADLLPRYQDGAWFVDLAPVTDPALIPAAVAKALGVPEAAGRPILDEVKEHLRHRELLLVVDNFEQVAEAGPVIEELLGAAPGLRTMVTSRVVLSLRGEQEYPVPPLPGVEAVRLFCERAVAASPRFALTEENTPVVAEITARLDGLPLAIELAASRTKVLTPTQILARLERRLSILTSGARSLPERQRTLRAAIAWSYDLLDPVERRLFARLSVFAGGWTFESAEAVCDPEALGVDALDGLTSLVDQSLVRRVESPGRPPRFAMLETIREFGREQLEASGDLAPVLGRHTEHFLDLAVEAEPHLTGADQGDWLDRCDSEHANIRAALRWAIDTGEAGRGLALAGGGPGHAVGAGADRGPGQGPGRGGRDRLVDRPGARPGLLRGGPGHRAAARRPRRPGRGPLQPGVRRRRRGRLGLGGPPAGGGPGPVPPAGRRARGRPGPDHAAGPGGHGRQLGAGDRRDRGGGGHLAAAPQPARPGLRPGLAGVRLRPRRAPGGRPGHRV